jgi:hypothetical protein
MKIKNLLINQQPLKQDKQISPDLELLKFEKFLVVCLTNIKNNQILFD